MKRAMKTLVIVSMVILSSYFTSSCEKKEFEEIKEKIENKTDEKKKEIKEENKKEEESKKEENTPEGNSKQEQKEDDNQNGEEGNTNKEPNKENPKEDVTPEQPEENNKQEETDKTEEQTSDNVTPQKPNDGNQQGSTDNEDNKPKEEKPKDNATPNNPNEGNQSGGIGEVEKKPEENNPNNGSQPSIPNEGNQDNGNTKPSVPNVPDNTPKLPDNNNQPNQSDNNGHNNSNTTEENNDSKEVTLDDLRSKLVVMDFTGQSCGACGYELLYNISSFESDQKFSNNVYFVSIHGSYGSSRVLYNQHAGSYSNYKKNRFLPYISFNNIKDNKVIDSYYLEEEINAKRVLKTDIKATLTAGNSLDITVVAKKVKNGGRLKATKVNVLLWVLENDIETYQYTNRYQTIKHKHVLRGYLNEMWGQQYNLGDKYTFKGKMINTVKDPKNCEILAIIIDANTKEFIDAEKVKL